MSAASGKEAVLFREKGPKSFCFPVAHAPAQVLPILLLQKGHGRSHSGEAKAFWSFFSKKDYFLAFCLTALAHTGNAHAGYLEACATRLGRSADPVLLASCYQAQAAIDAAANLSRATYITGFATLAAGACALLGSAVASIVAIKSVDRSERRRNLDRTRTYAGAFLAEIGSVLTFLQEVDLVGSLREQAKTNTWRPFHPGHASSWLPTYYARPESAGYLPPDLSRELVWFHARTYSQFARLIWLHETVEMRTGADPAERCRVQSSIAEMLEEIDRRGHVLLRGIAHAAAEQGRK